LLALLLIGVGLAAYYSSFEGAFLLDDNPRIVNNPQIRQLWPPWAVMAQSSRPILQLSLALNYALGGVNPWGYHAVNLAVHVLAGLLLFGIVRRMLESDGLRARYGGASRWLAAAVAGIWLVHPLHTESVTYIIQRAESLMGLWFPLTLYCGIRACRSAHPRGWGIAAVLACALGMGSKEVMVSAPIVMWLYDRMFISRTFRETFRRRWGLYAGLGATWLVLGASVATNRADEQAFMVAGLNPWSYALTQCEVIVHYLRLAAWPHPLVFDYAWPIADPLSSVLSSAVVVLALIVGTALALQRRLWVGFWGAWFFLILAPTASILPIADVAFEHRMYLPLAAVVVVTVIGGHDLLALLGRRLLVSENLLGWLEADLVVAVVAVLGYATVHRNAGYRSELAMWSDTVAKRPDNRRAHGNLGNALDRPGKLGEALAHYSEAPRLKPDFPQAQNNLGAALYRQGQFKEAAAHSAEALRLDPNFAEAHNNLGAAFGGQGKFEEAIGHFAEAVRLKPDFTEARDSLRKAQASLPRAKDAR
jgi:tetratricopeptide (TPR) repeat protein